MAALVSLVMTDIVGSTLRWAADDAAMSADLELHDRLLRDIVTGAGGTVVKHTGDGMLAVFDDPAAAVGAAASIQRAIGDTAWQHVDGLQVRAAVHTGTVHRRDDDVFGTAVNRVARLLGICPPGAVLLSAVVAELLSERGPEGLTLRALDSVQLAGFSSPDRVWAIEGAGLAEVSAPEIAQGERDRAWMLPSIDDELVGREDELDAVWDALDRSRLVTLVGVGGMGKTRLALEVASGAVEAFPDGVWWIDLSLATAEAAALPVAMAVVGAREMAGLPPLDAFCLRLASRRALVVFDNCEHVLGAARDIVSALRSASDEVRIVCTSREAIGLRGERLVPVGSLIERDGIDLFAERALAVRPDLDIDGHRDEIARLCSRLDGIPLAIELAAARCRSMMPGEVLARLDDRFRLLRGGRAGVERHRTLLAAVEWSYAMLDPVEQTVFDALAVFAGGTLVDGLAAVTGLDEFDLLDVVDRLVARSMVVATPSPLGTRYHQLETLRTFGEDRLVAAGAIAAVRDRHLLWVHHLSEWVHLSNGTTRGAEALRRFRVEVDNLRVAVAHALGTDRRPLAIAIVGNLFWQVVFVPAWEVAEWIRPLRPGDGWSEATVNAAAALLMIDDERGSDSIRNDPTGGIPDEFLRHNSAALMAVVDVLTIRMADVSGACDLIERFQPRSELGRVMRDNCWLQFALTIGPGEQASDDEVDRRGRGVIERAHHLGDELLTALTGLFVGYAFALRRPAHAIELLDETIDRASKLGVQFIAEVATTAASIATAANPEFDMSSSARARALRDLIGRALDQRHLLQAGILAGYASRLLQYSEPEVALLILDSMDRFTSRSDWRRVSGIAGSTDDDVDSSDPPADAVSLPDSITQVLAALDRIIAATEEGD